MALASRPALALTLAGFIAVAIALPLPGTYDVTVFKIWSYNAATLGPAEVYGTGGWPPTRRVLTYDGMSSQVDYPPVAIYELAVLGIGYRALFPTFPNAPAFTIALKLLTGTASLGLSALIFWEVRRIAGIAAGRWAALAYWINPAVMLNGAVLGYLDPLCALPAVGALIAATRQIGWAAGALLALACLTKPQAVLVLPSVALALWRPTAGRWRGAGPAMLAAGVVTGVCVWPMISAGAFGNMALAVARLVTDGTLSANSTNLWWLVAYVDQATHSAAGTTWTTALTTPVDLMGMRPFLAQVGGDSSLWSVAALALSAWVVVGAAVGWAMWHARGSADLPRLAALSAFTVHAYVVLAVQVHENHLFLALPLLAIVAATRPEYRSLFAGVSAIAALNLNLFYGLGDQVGYAIPRTMSGIDATVILAVLNCAALVWHGAAFRRECASTEGISGRSGFSRLRA